MLTRKIKPETSKITDTLETSPYVSKFYFIVSLHSISIPVV